MPPISYLWQDLPVEISSWIHDRLPEMLWAALIVRNLDRDYALAQFRRILIFIGEHEQREELHDLTLSGIAELHEALRSDLIRHIVRPPKVSRILTSLLHFESLPARDDWRRNLPETEPDLDVLIGSVGATLWHQSQEATDCRWMRLMAKAIGGKLSMPREMAEELRKYPHEGDQGLVEARIRAMEISFGPEEETDSTWPEAFWRESWESTLCFEVIREFEMHAVEESINRQCISDLREHLEVHWQQTLTTTSVNAKHYAIFGMAFFCLRILEEMLDIGVGTSILGRLGLRTIVEVRINLGFLLMKDSPSLWEKWRDFGTGQAKLNSLKFDNSMDPPKYIDVNALEKIANEDVGEEFLTVNLGNWSGIDLRKMSERSDLKAVYDRHYSWASGYSHGMWGAIRESCFRTCMNPLHRLHSFPQRMPLQDTVDDAAILVDEIIQQVDCAYPTFGWRLKERNSKAPT